MSYNKSQLRKEDKKVFNSSQRKDSEVTNAERSSLPLNNRLVWIPGKSNTSKHINNKSNNREIDNSSTTSTQFKETMDNLNHNSSQTTKTYTVINITCTESSQEKVPIILTNTRQVIVLEQPQKKITKKKYNYYSKKSKDNTDYCSSSLKNEQNVISVTDQHTKSLEDSSLTNLIEDVIQKEKEDEFDIVFLNNQQQLEIKTIHI